METMKVQWTSEQAFVAQLKLNAEQAEQLLTQTTNQVHILQNHMHTAVSQLQQAEGALKATEDSLRLFIDLHPDDPSMIAMAGEN
jgi:hypothetical protein